MVGAWSGLGYPAVPGLPLRGFVAGRCGSLPAARAPEPRGTARHRDLACAELSVKRDELDECRRRFEFEDLQHSGCTWNCSVKRAAPFYEKRRLHESRSCQLDEMSLQSFEIAGGEPTRDEFLSQGSPVMPSSRNETSRVGQMPLGVWLLLGFLPVAIAEGILQRSAMGIKLQGISGVLILAPQVVGCRGFAGTSLKESFDLALTASAQVRLLLSALTGFALVALHQ
eukprot:Skav222325  [mRNA]  locus=scaffold1249:284706:295193:- [translate_table: standard]